MLLYDNVLQLLCTHTYGNKRKTRVGTVYRTQDEANFDLKQ